MSARRARVAPSAPTPSRARVVGLGDLEDLVLRVERLHPHGTGSVPVEQLRLDIVAWATERFDPSQLS